MAIGELVYVRTCNQDPGVTPADPGPECYWMQVSSANLLQASPMTATEYTDIFNGVVYIAVIIFIVAMIKKAIEQ